MNLKDFENMDSGLNEVMREQEILKNFETALTSKAKALIDQFYPDELRNLSAKGYLELEHVISRYTNNLAVNISSIIYEHDES
jgi:hypothetical protein